LGRKAKDKSSDTANGLILSYAKSNCHFLVYTK